MTPERIAELRACESHPSHGMRAEIVRLTQLLDVATRAATR